jgi:DNA-binding transcriptional regulator YiaG
VAACEKRGGAGPGPVVAAGETADSLRFRKDGLKTHRAKLGLSAKDYGTLVGVSGLTIYHWESGKSKPRRRQLPAIAAVRSLGKREALARLSRK